METRYGPRPGEGGPRRYGPVGQVAVLSDVHANIPALEAVLAEVDGSGADLIVFCGDLTWGPEPDRTVELTTARGGQALSCAETPNGQWWTWPRGIGNRTRNGRAG